MGQTRMRVRVDDQGQVDLAALRAAGAHGAMMPEAGIVHVLVGLGAEAYLPAFRRAST